MNCCLCMNETFIGVDIFGEEGKELHINEMIEKFFWFKPNEPDPALNTICYACWSTVNDFYILYNQVEQTHDENGPKMKDIRADSRASKASQGTSNLEVSLGSMHESENNNYSGEQNYDEAQEWAGAEGGEEEYYEGEDEQYYDSATENGEVEGDFEEEEDYDDVSAQSNVQHYLIQECSNQASDAEPCLIECPPPQGKCSRKGMKQRMQAIDAQIAQVLQLKCDICELIEPSYNRLVRHMKHVHKVEAYVICCGKKFISKAYLISHVYSHLVPHRYRCKICGRDFSSKPALDQHNEKKHPNLFGPGFACLRCDRSFPQKAQLRQHQVAHRRDPPSPPPCRVCNHNPQASIPVQEVECRDATTSPFNPDNMLQFQCEICSKWYKNHFALLQHKVKHEPETSIFKCRVCHKISPNHRASLQHMNEHTAAKRKFKCKICHKRFPKSLSLIEHMTIHNAEKEQKCPQCPKTFSSAAEMTSHIAGTHPPRSHIEPLSWRNPANCRQVYRSNR